jgi:hypothetical protein
MRQPRGAPVRISLADFCRVANGFRMPLPAAMAQGRLSQPVKSDRRSFKAFAPDDTTGIPFCSKLAVYRKPRVPIQAADESRMR